jgi:hypothetical protein
MSPWAVVAAAALLFFVLLDAFETIVLPRRVTRRLRLTRLFYRSSWLPWRFVARNIGAGKRRDGLLAFFGPLSLIFLFAVWALGLVVGFALLEYGWGSPLQAGRARPGFWTDLYMSGTTLFTLGLGDVTPNSTRSRVLTVFEAGLGFGFLALVIGYLPILYQSFSRREVTVSLLDARAGSPPTAAELLRRHAENLDELGDLLSKWEIWCADLLESAISYPVLCYFRSQHDNQSWLSSLTTILDTCALAIVGIDGACSRQAKLTFAIARHAVVDLAQVFRAVPRSNHDRLPPPELDRLRQFIARQGLRLRDSDEATTKLRDLRGMYEPYVISLSEYLLLPLPEWIARAEVIDNWKTSAWGRIGGFAPTERVNIDDHA